MDCKDGATIVLGGLIQTRELAVEEKIPLLGDVPILGSLFKNIHSQEARSNLLFFLRPKIINPISSKDTEIILPPATGELANPASEGQEVIKPPPPKELKGAGDKKGPDKGEGQGRLE